MYYNALANKKLLSKYILKILKKIIVDDLSSLLNLCRYFIEKALKLISY